MNSEYLEFFGLGDIYKFLIDEGNDPKDVETYFKKLFEPNEGAILCNEK